MRETQNSLSINCSFLFYVMQYCIYGKDNNTMRTVLVLFCFDIFKRKGDRNLC